MWLQLLLTGKSRGQLFFLATYERSLDVLDVTLPCSASPYAHASNKDPSLSLKYDSETILQAEYLSFHS